jgi:integrase
MRKGGVMARAKPQRTKHPGVYKRKTTHGTVYDIAVRMPGKSNPVWERGKWTNLEDANRRRLSLLHEVHHGHDPFGSKPRTLADFAENDWLPRVRASASQGNLEASTVYTYERDLRGHIIPAFGATRLDRIGVEQIERWQDSLSADNYSNWTVRRLVTTLGNVLDLARRRKIIAANPVGDVEKPSARRRREPVVLSLEQVYKLADAAESIDERNLVLTAAFTGARISELFGLRWQHVDLDGSPPALVIAEQVYQGVHKDRAKTPSGYREVILPPPAVDGLRSQQIEGRHSERGIVFPAPEGGYWRASNFNRRQWRAIREAATLPELHFHDLRHFYVSHVRNAGLPTSITEQLVGHSDERTHRGYTHAVPGTEQVIYEGLTRAFDQSADQ